MILDPAPSNPVEGNTGLFVLTPDHVSETYLGWMKDADVQRYLESRLSTHDMASLEAFVRACLEAPDLLLLGIAHDGRHVGNIKIGPINGHHRTAEVGIMVGDRSVHGRGVGTAAIRIVVRIAKEQLGLVKLTAGAYASNRASIRAFQKAGFEVEGVRRSQYLLGEGRDDLVLMGMLV